MKTPLQLTGIGLRAPHHAEFLLQPPSVAWVEVHSENFFAEGGKALHTLEQIRKNCPVSLHGVSLSIGSADELNWQHLKKLRDLVLRIDPCLVSDHLCWSSVDSHYIHDLLPLPFTNETVQHCVTRIQQIQEYLGKQILVENISRYLGFQDDELSEAEFMTQIIQQSGCGILLDVSNAYINAINLNEDAESFIYALPSASVQEIHLAGFTATSIDGAEVLIDSHDQPVCPEVWNLYRKVIAHLGVKPTIIEWDNELPTLETLYLEALRAETIMRETYVPAKHTG